VINIEVKRSRQSKDILNKYTSALFKDMTLEFFGVKTAKIKEMISGELPAVEVSVLRTDCIFLLEDDTYQHLEFETSYNKENLVRFAKYDLYLYERDKRKISTTIIYSAEVKNADRSLEIGSLAYTPNVVMMRDYDGGAIFAELEAKLTNSEDLTDKDILNLIFLPLMRHTQPKYELVEKSIKLANTIPEQNKRDGCIASTVNFAEEYLDDDDKKRILEVIKLPSIMEMLLTEKMLETAKKLLKKGISIEDISESTELSIETIKELQEELAEEATA